MQIGNVGTVFPHQHGQRAAVDNHPAITAVAGGIGRRVGKAPIIKGTAASHIQGGNQSGTDKGYNIQQANR